MTARRRSASNGSSSDDRPSWHGPSIVLAVAVLASPLAIGGVHAVVAAGLATLSLIGLWWALAGGDAADEQTGLIAVSIPILGFCVMALACLVQLIPVPTGLYRLIQPAGHSQWAANFEVLDSAAPSGWHLLSLDPRATSEHALKWIALAATTALAGTVVADRRRRRMWLGLVLIGGGIVAVAGFVQQLVGTDLILGFYDSQVGARSVSAFVSTNHAATYYGLLALLGVAYGLDHLRRSPLKASLGAGASVLFLLLCASHNSDGALLALGAGLVVLAVAALRRFTRGSTGRRRTVGVGAVGLLVVAAFAAMLIPSDWTLADDRPDLDETSAQTRLLLSQGALEAAADHPVVGTGAGSVERTIRPYLDYTELRGQTVPTIENEPVEWIMTLGPVVGLVAIGLFGFVLARLVPHLWRRRGRRGPAVATAILVFMGIVSLFHFPFFTLGISLVAAVALEACLDRNRDAVFVHVRPRAAMVFAAALTVAVAGLVVARNTVVAPGAEADLEVDAPDRVDRAVHMYPTDGRLLSAISLRAREEGDDDRALRLAERAFEARPHPQQEVLVARSHAAVGDDQQAAEVYARLTDADRAGSRGYAWAEDRIRHDLEDPRLRAVAIADATDDHQQRFFRRIHTAESAFPAIELGLELIEMRPDRPVPHLQLVEMYRETGQQMLAEMYARSLVDRNLVGPDGERPAGLNALLEIFTDQDRHDEARNMADRAFDTGHATRELGQTTVELMPDDPTDLDDDHRELFDAALDVGCQPPYERRERRTCWQGRALLAEADGDIDQAESLLSRIERVEDDPRPLIELLARHHRCGSLASLERRYTDERHHSTIESALDDCVEYEGLD